jgi:hypothetical protein
MNKIILPRGCGKTTKLIDISEKTGTYILVANMNRQRQVADMAREQSKMIPFPVTLEDFLRTRFRGIVYQPYPDRRRRRRPGPFIRTYTD